tara:strand:+ start:1655 stop:1894 length:240 start_codon:yes stop_codon:yes gene_type:complete
MVSTTIKLNPLTKTKLDHFREYKSETYDEVVNKLMYIVNLCKKKPELSLETIHAIEQARIRMKKGKFLTEEEAKRRLGL